MKFETALGNHKGKCGDRFSLMVYGQFEAVHQEVANEKLKLLVLISGWRLGDYIEGGGAQPTRSGELFASLHAVRNCDQGPKR